MASRILLSATVGWPSAARYAAGFVAAGCVVDALSPAGAPVRVSRFVGRHFDYSPLFPIASLRAAIVQSDAELIVACDDRAVVHLLELYRLEKQRSTAIATLIARSLGRPENYPLVMSRHGANEAMRAEGVRVPASFSVKDELALDTALAEIGFPAVLKVDGSWGGEGVVIVTSPAQAHAAFKKLVKPPARWRSLARAVRRKDAHFVHDAIAPKTRTVSLQKFIPGIPAASAFAARDGHVVGAIAYDVLVAQDTIGPPNIIRRVDCQEIHTAAQKVARRFGLSGLHGLDFIRDDTGAVHLIEINPRATQGGTLAFGAGRDLPAALAATLSQSNLGIRPAISNDTVAFFPRAWQRNGGQAGFDLAHHDIPWDDPALLLSVLGLPVEPHNDNDLHALVYAELGKLR